MSTTTKNPYLLPLLTLLLSSSTLTTPQYIPTDMIFLNCGSSSNSTDSDGRKWTSDTAATTTAATATIQRPSVPETPYMTARIFHSEFTYSFAVTSGRKFLRLYFYPAPYNALDPSNAVFSVITAPYTLLSSFSPAQTSRALNLDYIIKEFSLHVPSHDVLNITFIPSRNSTSNSYGFINGVEIVSHPYGMYSIDGHGNGNNTVLQNLYRLNVGGNSIVPCNDTGLFRAWNDDSGYIFSSAFGVTQVPDRGVTVEYSPPRLSYIAPLEVYATMRSMGPNYSVNKNFNLTWLFRVDSGFSYLVRLHFCEITNHINKVNQRVFSVFLNNQTVEKKADVIAWAGRNGVPVHRDYVVNVPHDQALQDFWLDLHPYIDSRPQYYNAFLNGLEIFKINDSTGNLAGPNPIPNSKPDQSSINYVSPGGSRKNHNVAIEGGGIAAFLILCLIACFLFHRRFRPKKDLGSSQGWLIGNSQGNLCRHFSIDEIRAATNDFDEALVIGIGGFGKVYVGEIERGIKVAIKRGNPLSQQGVQEFETEIETLSKLRHKHLVSLKGYCEDNSEMILVYDYMEQGTLREHLYRTSKPPLTWKKRLEICIGAARGLHYLHTGAKQTIIHRDVKTTNILLDGNWVAKVSDFGISKTGPSLDQTHVSTLVKGSLGYLDPEYFRRQQLTEKSDVYSYGVVLLEVLCARSPLSCTLPKEQESLVEWALHCYGKGMLDQIVDPFLEGKIGVECLEKFVQTAVKCVSAVGINRPSMGDVLWSLELAMQLQKSAEEKGEIVVECIVKTDIDLPPCSDGNYMDLNSIGLASEEDAGEMNPSTVFSQLMDPKGR